MSNKMMLIAVLLPIISGIIVMAMPHSKTKTRNTFIELMTVITSIIIFMLIFKSPKEALTIFKFTGQLTIGLKLDGTGKVFCAIIAFLWPFATLYAFEYMEHEHRQNFFFGFYMITYGVTAGIAMSEGIISLYFFYEMLTMVTIPLVIHELNPESVYATRTYMYYSLGGAAFAFIGMIFLLMFGTSSSFTSGGVLDMTAVGDRVNLILIVYVLCFCGFSVKAAMFPFSSWLPKAGVAPTPVTALLHAVAVVKAGAFACIRVTYFCFGTEILKGTWAQYLLLGLTMFTIVYGCSRALKETHFKRRLAWSTVSNLSYILFGALIMSPAGLDAALSHMVCHALIKITAFFCAGAVIHKANKNYIHELDGLGRKMPKIFSVFTLSGLALMGVPGLAGFVSKWNLAEAAAAEGTLWGYLGIGAILISALLTAIYMMTISVRAYFPGKDFDFSKDAEIQDPTWRMVLPLVVFVIVMFIIGLNPSYLNNAISSATAGLF
ncbi:MAG: proton-conducting transporter membrane subunit [Clostridia bacterium]|nr:proton-conducting transporter membrane subunit [Clostridia bacterium]